MIAKHPVTPISNWVYSNLNKGISGLLVNGKITQIQIDEITNNILYETLVCAQQPGNHTIRLYNCKTPILPFLGFSLAYYLQDIQAPKNQVVIVYSKDQYYLDLAKSFVPFTPSRHAVDYFFPPVIIQGHIHNIQSMRKPSGALDRPRVVFTTVFNDDIYYKLLRNDVMPRYVLIDGRTLSQSEITSIIRVSQNCSDCSFILCSPSDFLSIPTFSDPKPLPPSIGKPINIKWGKPILVHEPDVQPNYDLHIVDVHDDVCRNLFDGIEAHRHRLPIEFLRTAFEIYRTLLALPIKPNELNSAWRYNVGLLEHPISIPLARLKMIARYSDTPSDSDRQIMDDIIRNLEGLSVFLDNVSPKFEELERILESVDNGAIVIVNRTATAHALSAIFSGHYPEILFTTWYDPPTWAPTKKTVILCCPPPRGREWMLQTQLSGKVMFIISTTETEMLLSSVQRLGVDGSSLIHSINQRVGKVTNLDRLPDDISTTFSIINLERALTIDSRMTFKSQTTHSGEVDTVVPVILQDCGILWARPSSVIATIRNDKILYLEPKHLKPDDTILLPKQAPAEHIQEAFFIAAEAIPMNSKYVQTVNQWKKAVKEYRRENHLSVDAFVKDLNAQGAEITNQQYRNIFEPIGPRFRQIATLEPYHLVKASLIVTRGSARGAEITEICEAISHFKGIHINAGKWLRKLAEAAFLTTDKELETVLDQQLGLTIGALIEQISVYQVESIENDTEVPYTLAGSIEFTVEEPD